MSLSELQHFVHAELLDGGGWNVDEIVTALRDIREQSLEGRQRLSNPPKLPSRKALQEIVEGLTAALFPNRLVSPDLAKGGVDYFVGHTLDVALRKLLLQLQRELLFSSKVETNLPAVRDRAAEIAVNFAQELPAIRVLLESDIEAAYQGDPAAQSVDEVLVCYPGIVANIHYRLAHVLFSQGARLIARMISEIAHSVTGIDIHPGASIGESFFIDHGTGVVIGETAIIGNRVRLYQAVTLGAKRFPTDENGNLIKGNARHPIVEDDVVVYAGATILGRVTIGRGSVIGGNVWLTRSVPPCSNISQAQVRHELFDGGAGI
ncbi:serine acetyltransferase [Candidatus Methylospira mobilis]|uniref:serine O-acetyltransferase n=1 Tax=Candidatus Methylospira mobilis TaxID=1808979 RepID=A0A5Q0BQ13_9GAMM|nr:serine O-acetyltransferase EpsC [Candidatus Methylospira mobilis]QFY43806.1 serine acetyltransferase [Candidatus Methylospira mobilis]WNV04797.1 serine O-acetyltransferase EpsC [Candidatus Methylospira mobilis]